MTDIDTEILDGSIVRNVSQDEYGKVQAIDDDVVAVKVLDNAERRGKLELWKLSVVEWVPPRHRYRVINGGLRRLDTAEPPNPDDTVISIAVDNNGVPLNGEIVLVTHYTEGEGYYPDGETS